MLSKGQVRTIVANLDDKITPLFADQEDRPGWAVTLVPHGTVEVTRSDGAVMTDPPPGRIDQLLVA